MSAFMIRGSVDNALTRLTNSSEPREQAVTEAPPTTGRWGRLRRGLKQRTHASPGHDRCCAYGPGSAPSA